ncbi:MAG: helix-turn-helix domain-containing protein [Burkholderiaceae bacterium]
MSVLGKRLKAARLRAGLSQEQLGLEAGLDAMSASARMNRYELGKRVPDFSLMQEIARVLEMPAPYFYADDDVMAELIAQSGKLSTEALAALAKSLEKNGVAEPGAERVLD